MDIEKMPFHRRGAKYAKNIFLMFAVERTANIRANLLQTLVMIYS